MIAGDGKLMYSLAYALSPTGTIIPDRSAVSKTARVAWKKVAASGKTKSKDLDDVNNPQTEPKEDDCDVWGDAANDGVLDKAYQLTNNPVDAKTMVANHKKFLKWLEEEVAASDHGFDVSIDEKQIEEVIDSAGQSVFSQAYKKNKK